MIDESSEGVAWATGTAQMTRRTTAAGRLVACTMLATTLSFPAATAAQRDLPIRKAFACGPIPARTLADAYGIAETIARVRLLDHRYRTLEHGLVATQYTAAVIDYVKSSRGTPPTIQIYRIGGVVHAPGESYRLVVSGYPEFSVGEEYVLFLAWNEHVGAFSPWGPELAFLVDPWTDALVPLGRSELPARFRGRPARDLIADLDALKR
jgi:hypothetical protein